MIFMSILPQDIPTKYSYSTRLKKAWKIEKILQDALGGHLGGQQFCVLDLGCSIGVITSRLAGLFNKVFGFDIDLEAIAIAKRLNPATGAVFICGDALALPFKDQHFDVVVCAQVYEHTKNPQSLFTEINRILKAGGCCFFSGPNKWWPIEYHFHWYFIHWFPRKIIDNFCRMRYARYFDLTLYNYWQLRGYWKNYECIDYSIRLLYEPGPLLNQPDRFPWIRWLPIKFINILRFLSPNFNWVLLKKF
jgi:SAM-dependent methyltransferase